MKTVNSLTNNRGIYVAPGVYRDPSSQNMYQSKSGKVPQPNAIPKFNPYKDNRWGSYYKEWSSAKDPNRKAAIDKQWGFSKLNPEFKGDQNLSSLYNTFSQTKQGTPEYNQARDAYNDARDRFGLKTNRLPGETLTYGNTGAGGMNNPNKGVPSTPVDFSNPPGTPAPTPTPPGDNPMMKTLFPDFSKFLMGNFYNVASPTMDQVQESAGYKWQKDRGLRDLERIMAAQGLTGSGASIEANSQFLNELGANEWSRVQEQANRDRDVAVNLATDNSKTLLGILNNEQERQQYMSDAEWNRFRDVATLALAQDPNVFNAINQNANNLSGSGKDLASMMQALAQRVIAPGGRSNNGQFVPPSSMRPDTSGSDQLALINGGYTTGGYNDLLKSVLGLFTNEADKKASS
jgi:hypothetical protein